VSFTLRRHFDATRIMLFFEDLVACPTALLVSRGDTIMASDTILEGAAACAVPGLIACAFDEGRAPVEHGTWCHDLPMNLRVFEAIQDVSRQAAERLAKTKL